MNTRWVKLFNFLKKKTPQDQSSDHSLSFVLHDGKNNQAMLAKLAFAFLEEQNAQGFFQVFPHLREDPRSFSGFVEQYRSDKFGKKTHNLYDVLEVHLENGKKKKNEALIIGSRHDIKHFDPLKPLIIYYETLFDSEFHPSVDDVCNFFQHKDLLRLYFGFLQKKNKLTEKMVDWLHSPQFVIDTDYSSFVKEWVQSGGDILWQNDNGEGLGHLVFSPQSKRDILRSIYLLRALLDHGLKNVGPSVGGCSIFQLLQKQLNQSGLSFSHLPKQHQQTWEELHSHDLKNLITSSLQDCVAKRQSTPKKKM